MSNSNETNREIIHSGVCGECTWTIDADGLLLIAPTDGVRGLLEDITWISDLWKKHKETIITVYIAEGVMANSKMQAMFDNCKNMVTADLRNLDTSNLSDMSWMFCGCSSLTSLYASDTFGLDANTEYIFDDCPCLVAPDVLGLKKVMIRVHNKYDDKYGEIYAVGSCGECSCTLYSNGLLVIAPTNGESGKLDEISSSRPWSNSEYKKSIKRVILESGVKANNYLRYMFEGCRNMTSIDFADFDASNLWDKGTDNMFDWCESLNSIDLSRVTRMNSVGDRTFRGCKALTTLILPESVSRIGSEAFLDCENLISVTIPNNKRSYEVDQNSEGDISWRVPNYTSKIGKDAFMNCPATLIVRRGSWAEDQAKENGTPYEYLTDTKVEKKPMDEPVEEPSKKMGGRKRTLRRERNR